MSCPRLRRSPLSLELRPFNARDAEVRTDVASRDAHVLRFTSKAIPWGKEHRIHLVDRRTLGEWATGSRPLWDLLDRIPPPRRPTALSRRECRGTDAVK